MFLPFPCVTNAEWRVMLVVMSIIISTTYWAVMLNFGICQTFELCFQALCSGGVVKVLG